jgi:tRNA nucleotidyltransferase (CCA-adding enzyme)
VVRMLSNIERIKARVLKKVKPSEVERKRVLLLANRLVEKTEAAARKAGVETTVRVEGSVAKDTWLREEPDIDIFMKLPTSVPRKALGNTCLRIAKKATKGSIQTERFAEHPYLEAFVDSIRVNIVPCYSVKPGEWLSATDRTPYHTDFVKPKLNETLRDEIRLLKRFMKGIDVYGAEIKIGGFSGYLCELLILNHSTFVKTLEAAADWNNPWIIDYARHYDGRENEIPKLFDEPLIVIDPVDKGRNVAAAVRQERLIEFVAASRRFLQDPAEFFFYPKPTKAFDERQLVKHMQSQGTSFVFVEFGPVKTVPDILWGQLYRTQRSLHNMIEKSDFRVVNSTVWSEEKLNVLIFEIEHRLLPQSKKHLGPPVERRHESEDFLQKHLRSPATLSGPRLENGRWIVDVKRKQLDVVGLLHHNLRNGGRHVGVAELIAKAMTESFKILINEEIVETYLSADDFAVFLTDYLIGKPRWLRRTSLSRGSPA